jgi:hypothetical protein
VVQSIVVQGPGSRADTAAPRGQSSRRRWKRRWRRRSGKGQTDGDTAILRAAAPTGATGGDTLELRVPWDRAGRFWTALFERHQGSNEALVGAIFSKFVLLFNNFQNLTVQDKQWIQPILKYLLDRKADKTVCRIAGFTRTSADPNRVRPDADPRPNSG